MGHEDKMNRTSFISSISAAAAVAFLRDVALADAIGGKVSMAPLVETILPIGSPDFPAVSAPVVAVRMESLYHLAESRTFMGSLAAFMQPTSFSKPSALLYAAEQSTTTEVNVEQMTIRDARAYAIAALP